MESERERIQRLLDGQKISLVEAERLLEALEEKKEEEAEPEVEVTISVVGNKNRSLIFILIGIAILIIIFYFVFRGPGSIDTETNLLLNPGFEKGENGEVASWVGGAAYGGGEFLGGSKGGAIFSWDDKVSHRGGRSVVINNMQGKNRKALNWRQQIKSFPAERKVKLSGFLRSRGISVNGRASLVLRGLRGLKEEIFLATTAMSYDLTGTKEWTEVHLQVVVSDGTEELQILCQLEGSGTLWCDDLALSVVE